MYRCNIHSNSGCESYHDNCERKHNNLYWFNFCHYTGRWSLDRCCTSRYFIYLGNYAKCINRRWIEPKFATSKCFSNISEQRSVNTTIVVYSYSSIYKCRINMFRCTIHRNSECIERCTNSKCRCQPNYLPKCNSRILCNDNQCRNWILGNNG